MSQEMQAVEVPAAGEAFEVTSRPIPEPGTDEVRVAVEACGICHSDAFVKEGTFPGIDYPRVPGHEIAGRVDAVGDGVTAWAEGDRVGVGWHGGHCFTCESCRRGDFVTCENGQITGLTHDGGYAEYAVVPEESVAAMPPELDAVEAAPLLCAGVTTYNALRNSHAVAGDLVAIQGVGGLGHLGVQYAHAAGYETVAVSRGTDKEELARDLGADHFVDAEGEDPAEALQALGGADVILGTAPSAAAMESIAGGLGVDGRLIAVGVPGEGVEVPLGQFVAGRQGVEAWASGTARDSQDTLEFSELREIAPMVETYDLADAAEAYDRMMANDARFRVVLEP